VASETISSGNPRAVEGHLNQSTHARPAASDAELASAWSIVDVPEDRAVTAWRCWRLLDHGRLAALGDGHGMWHGGVMEALCGALPDIPSPSPLLDTGPPDPACTCGIAGYADREEAETTRQMLGSWQPVVLGEVRLWGGVLVREGAYRAEFSRITDPPDLVSSASPPLRSLLWSWCFGSRGLAWMELFGHSRCFANLLDNPVALAPGEDPLHVRDEMLVAGGDDEMSRIRANSLVLLRRQRDPRGAFWRGALAEPVRQRHPKIGVPC
jgi:hypothetical protein